MNRLLISIIGLLGFCVAKADGIAYSPDGGMRKQILTSSICGCSIWLFQLVTHCVTN